LNIEVTPGLSVLQRPGGWAEPYIRSIERPHAADEERRAREQHHSDRHLPADDQPLKPPRLSGERWRATVAKAFIVLKIWQPVGC
jgi:hypothetical protein